MIISSFITESNKISFLLDLLQNATYNYDREVEVLKYIWNYFFDDDEEEIKESYKKLLPFFLLAIVVIIVSNF